MAKSEHHIHSIGSPVCVEHGCEPQMAAAPMLPPYDEPVRESARRMGNSPRAWAAARRMEDRR